MDYRDEELLNKAFDQTESQPQTTFKFGLLNGEFLSNFKAPTTEKIYNHKTERSVPLNKYLFTKEVPGFIPESKAILIDNLEKKIHEIASTLKDSQNTLKESYKAYNELDGSNQIKEINLEMGELIKKSKEDKSFEKNLFPKTEPKFYSSLTKDDLEYYKSSLGIEFKEEITKEEQDYLLEERNTKKTSNKDYSEKYFKILNNKTKVKSNDKFFDNLIQFYFEELKEGICTNELNWLNENYIFYAEDNRRRINDKSGDARSWKTPFDRGIGQKSWIETSLTNGLAEPLRYELHSDDNNVYPTNTNAYYNTTKLNNNLNVLRENGLEHIYPNHPIYKEHLAKKQEWKENESYQEKFDERKNKYFLENGHRYDTKTRELFDILKKLNVKGKNLINIKDFEEFQSLNFTKEEKEKFFLNILSVILISGIEKDIDKNKTFNEGKGFLSDESYNKYYEDILNGKFNGKEEFEKHKEDFIRYATPLSKKLSIHQFNFGEILTPMTKEDKELISKKEINIEDRTYLKQKKVRVRNDFFEDIYVPQEDFDRMKVKIELDENNYKVEVHPIEAIASEEDGTKFNYDEIKIKYPFIDFLKKDPNPSLSGIWSKRKGDMILELKKSEIPNLCNSGLSVEEDFEIIAKLLDKGLKSLDFTQEISKRKQLNKIWEEVYLPWNKIENDKYNFFETVRKRTKEDVKNSQEIKDFLSNIEVGASKTIDKFYEEYSYEIRSSNNFDSRFNTNELIKYIKEIYEKVLTTDFYVRNEMKGGTIDLKMNPNFEKRNLKDYEYDYNSNTYVKLDDLKDSVFFDDANNKFNQYMIDYQNALFQIEINKLKKHYDVATAGMQGAIIIDKVLNFFEENIPMSRCTGKANSNLLFLKNSNILQAEMIEKHGSDFFTKEKPVYFPTAKLILEQDIDYILKYYDKESFIYSNLIEMKANGMLEGFTHYSKENKWHKGFLNIDKQFELVKPIEALAAGLTFSKSEELNKVFELELKRSEVVTKHNKLVENIKEIDSTREEIQKRYFDLSDVLKKEKIENYTFENHIDKDKFFTVLSTIVDLVKNEENKDKIIDLSKFNNISGQQENEINLNKLYESFKQYYKIELENLNKTYEDKKAKCDVGSDEYKKLNFEHTSKKAGMLKIAGSYKESMLINYFLTINDLYRNHNTNYQKTTQNILLKDTIETNNLDVQTINVLNNFGSEIKKFLDPTGLRQNIEGFENNKDNDKLNIVAGQHFPLFIDISSDTIWTVEWTTKYPMLHITTLPDIFKIIKDISTMTKDEILDDMKKDVNDRKIKTSDFNFSEKDVDRIKFLVNSYLFIATDEENLKHGYISSLEALEELNKKFDLLEKTYTINDLDRIKDIFSLIQTNYFLQMDQPEENALFLDIDTNFLLKPKVNIGAVPFMNKDDLDLLGGVHNKDREAYNNNLKFIDPYNYSIEGKDESLSAFNINNRKVEGLPSEQKSKDDMNLMINEKKWFKENNKLNIFEKRELVGQTESLYGYNYLNYNKGESYNKSIYNLNPEKLKLFATKEELDNYIKKYNEVIDRDFDDKSLKRF